MESVDKFNIRILLSYSLGSSEYLSDDIESIYEEKRWLYYESYKNSEFYNDPFLKSFTAIKEERMKKALGIIEHSYKHNDFSKINQLIKKGYKNVLTFCNSRTKNKINFYNLTQYIIKRKKWGKYEIVHQELIMNCIVLLYILFTKTDNTGAFNIDEYGLYIKNELKNCYERKEFEFIFQQIIIFLERKEFVKMTNTKLTISEQEKAKKFLEDTFELTFNNQLPKSIWNIFDFISDNQLNKFSLENKIDLREMTPSEYDGAKDAVYNNNDTLKYMIAQFSYLSTSSLNLYDLLQIEISKETLLLQADNVIKAKKEKKLSDKETIQLFISILFNHALIEQYKKVKENYLTDSIESWYLDVKQKEKEINEKEVFHKKIEENNEKQLVIQTKINEELKGRIAQLELENKRLKQEAQSFIEEKEELIELRNFIYKQKRSDVDSIDDSLDVMIPLLKESKIIICGGHPNMLRKLKELVPTIETLNTETLNKDLRYLEKYEYVFFYPNYANHSFYQKIKTALKNTKTTKFFYLSDVDNIEIIISNIFKELKTTKK